MCIQRASGEPTWVTDTADHNLAKLAPTTRDGVYYLVVVHAPALIFLRWRIAGKHIEHCLRRYQVSCREQALDASLANVADAAQHG